MVPTVWSSMMGYKELSIKVSDKKEKFQNLLFLKRFGEFCWNFLHSILNNLLYQGLIYQKITLKYENISGNSIWTWQMHGSKLCRKVLFQGRIKVERKVKILLFCHKNLLFLEKITPFMFCCKEFNAKKTIIIHQLVFEIKIFVCYLII